MKSRVWPPPAARAVTAVAPSMLLAAWLAVVPAVMLSGCGDKPSAQAAPAGDAGPIAAPAGSRTPAAPIAATPTNAETSPPAAAAAGAGGGQNDPKADPFANVDPNASDVLRRILSVDEKARTARRKGVAAVPAGSTAPVASSPAPSATAFKGAAAAAPAGTAAVVGAPGAAPAGLTGSPGSAAVVPAGAAGAAGGTAAVTPASPSPSSTVAASPAPARPADPLAARDGAAQSASQTAGAPANASIGSTSPATNAATAPGPLALASPAAASRAAPPQLKAIARPDPVFPREALRDGVASGRVVAQLSVAPDGRVTDVRIVESVPAKVFDLAARRALQSWRFEPIREPVTAQVELLFRSE
jgi:TonB family protein